MEEKEEGEWKRERKEGKEERKEILVLKGRKEKERRGKKRSRCEEGERFERRDR